MYITAANITFSGAVIVHILVTVPEGRQTMFRGLTVIRRHASSYAFVELAEKKNIFSGTP